MEDTEDPRAQPDEPQDSSQQPQQDSEPAEAEQAPEAEQPGTEPEGEAAPGGATSEERAPETPRPRRRRDRDQGRTAEEEAPGAHLEPDLVLDTPQSSEDEYEVDEYARYVEETEPEVAEPEASSKSDRPAQAPVARKPIDLAADARYQATGKRKTSVARVILKPGQGEWTVNGRALNEFLPRSTLQRSVRQPLEQAGYEERMDVTARVHGGGVAAQAGALRHGVARALVEADPALRPELKQRGFLTRDSRAKERRKAGLKKARKRPQFSKR